MHFVSTIIHILINICLYVNSFHNTLTPWMKTVFCKDIITAVFDWLNQKASKLFYLCWKLRLIFVSVRFSYVDKSQFLSCVSQKKGFTKNILSVHEIPLKCEK